MNYSEVCLRPIGITYFNGSLELKLYLNER